MSSDWQERSVNIQTAAQEESVIIKFVFTGKGILQEEEAFDVDNGIIITDNIGGNWLYIDNIRIGNGNWQETNNITSINLDIIPQPITQENGIMRFNLTESDKLNILIYDVYGKIVFRETKIFPEGNNSYSLNNFINKNSSGLYVIKVFSNNFVNSKTFIFNKKI